jgi:excisionase family DNA binding protein
MEKTSYSPKTGAPAGIPPAILRIAQSASYIGCSRAFIYQLIQRGELPRIKLGGRAAGIRRSDLDSWLDAQPRG